MQRRIPRADYKIMPWKNGLGQTAEIDRFPADVENYAWRLSQADIQGDCPFSLFPGYERWLVVLRGDAILLNNAKLEPLSPYRFSGDEKIECRLTGEKVLDAGLIFDPIRTSAEMSVVQGTVELSARQVHYLIDVHSLDTLRLEGGGRLSVLKSVLVSIAPKT